MMDPRAQWVQATIGRNLTDFQQRAVVLLCEAMRCGPYDIGHNGRTFETAEWQYGHGVRFVVYRPKLATYDTDGLTALVLGAHEKAIRVEIGPVNFTHLAITMHPRARDAANQWGRHPSIEQVLARRAAR